MVPSTYPAIARSITPATFTTSTVGWFDWADADRGITRLLRVPALGLEERQTRFGHAVLSITARDALLEYLWLFFHMKTVARSLQRAKIVEVATEAIPGFRDVMVAGKLYELTAWRA